MDKLDKSLDELITSNGSGGGGGRRGAKFKRDGDGERGGGGRGRDRGEGGGNKRSFGGGDDDAGPVRRQKFSNSVRQSSAPYGNPLSRNGGGGSGGGFGGGGRRGNADDEAWSRGAGGGGGQSRGGRGAGSGGGGSLLDRLGPKAGAVGTKVLVSNLKFDVTDASELQELFGTVGEVLHATVKFDRAGRSTGEAEVAFAKQSDALKAVEKFNTRTLDGVPMTVKLAGRGDIENPLNPRDENDMEEEYVPRGRREREGVAGGGGAGGASKNVKQGFFGTALAEGGGGFGGGGGGRRGAGGVGDGVDGGRPVTFSVTIDEGGFGGGRRGGGGGGSRRGGRGGGGGSRGGGGGGGGRGGGGGGGGGRKVASAEDLDAELEAYNNQRSA